MSKKFARAQKVAAIVPLTMLSVAATASLAGVGTPGLSASAARLGGGPPAPSIEIPEDALRSGGSVLSAKAVDAMGSVAARGGLADISSTTSTSAIPSTALAAYQRAESVINAADESCHLSWQLVAAIGRVESDHGRFGGSSLDSDGLAQPPIVGIALDGTQQTSLISDTDGGRYDGDDEFDRAVGPMQFIPDTWSAIGVDADGDGQRNPQDIDDAALGTAVYLCSGDDDLATTSGQRAAVYRYNNSESYVDLVLAIAAAYLDGDYSAVPDNTVAAGTLTPVVSPPAARTGAGTAAPRGGGSSGAPTTTDESTRDGGGSSTGGSGGGSNDGNGGGGSDPTPEQPSTPDTGAGGAAKGVGEAVKGAGKTVGGAVKGGGKAVEDVLTYAEARTKCIGELGLVGGLLGLTSAQQAKLDACIAKYT